MNEPILIVIGTTPALILGTLCMILVTILAVRGYRQQRRTMQSVERYLQAARDLNIPPATWKDY